MINWEIFGSNIVVHESLHFFMASLVSILVYKKYHNFKYIIIVFLISFLIDVDHLTEWILVYKWHFFSILTQINGGHFREAGKMTVFFHSWEILLIVYFLGRLFKQKSLALVIILAIAGHLLVDQLVYSSLYGMSLLEYFFTYRAINHFDFFRLCGGCS